MANKAVKTFFSEVGTKIKSNKAIGGYLDNVSLKKHVINKANENIETASSSLRTSIKNLNTAKAEALADNATDDAKVINKYANAQRSAYARNRERQLALEEGNISLKEAFSNYNQTSMDQVRNGNRAMGQKGSLGKMDKKMITTGNAANLASSYLGIGGGLTKGQAIARYSTLGAGVGLGFGATRYARGGDLTHNSKGERDVVGVPFL